MTEDLQKLIEEALQIPFTAEEREAQRRSFAYGTQKLRMIYNARNDR